MSDKLAFLFLTYDGLNQHRIWKNFFDKANKKMYNLYAHNKEKSKDPITKNSSITLHSETFWGDSKTVIAIIYLLHTAYYSDEKNEKFLLISNSCVPLRTFMETYLALQEYKDESIFLLRNKNMNDSYTKWKIKQLKKYDKKYKTNIIKETTNIPKTETYWILCRKHVKLILQKTHTFIKPFLYFDTVVRTMNDRLKGKYTIAPEELYFIMLLKTYLSKFQFTKSVKLLADNNRTTYIKWNKIGDPRPQEYDTISKEEYDKIMSTKALFMRKVSRNTSFKFPS